MDKLQVFNFESHDVRTQLNSDEVWFCLKDVCDILELSNPSVVMDRLKESGRTKLNLGRAGDAWFIDEKNLYRVIFQSRKPQAERFQDWVYDEVLPTLRKTGKFEVVQDSYMIDDPIERAKRWIEEQEEKKQLKLLTQQQEQQIAELQPKADYLDTILQSKDLLTIRQIAQDYGMTATQMNKLLHELGVQYKQSGQWLLYSKHVSSGYTKSVTYVDQYTGRSTIYTKWTQKGRIFLYNLLKENNVLPVIEQQDDLAA